MPSAGSVLLGVAADSICCAMLANPFQFIACSGLVAKVGKIDRKKLDFDIRKLDFEFQHSLHAGLLDVGLFFLFYDLGCLFQPFAKCLLRYKNTFTS
jgi:hypothetical protein